VEEGGGKVWGVEVNVWRKGGGEVWEVKEAWSLVEGVRV
jgi:hypothetical protein